jgi:hypothetical protein
LKNWFQNLFFKWVSTLYRYGVVNVAALKGRVAAEVELHKLNPDVDP